MPSPLSPAGAVDIGVTVPALPVDPAHPGRCIGALGTSRRSTWSTSWREARQPRASTGASHSDGCTPSVQHPALRAGLVASSAELPWLLHDKNGERLSAFDEVLASFSVHLNRHMELLRAAHMQELHLAAGCEMTTPGPSESLANLGEVAWFAGRPVPEEESAALEPWRAPTSEVDDATSEAGDAPKIFGQTASSSAPADSMATEQSLKNLWHGAVHFQALGSDAEIMELDAKARRMFEEMDVDGSGSVSATEFFSLLRLYGIDDVSLEQVEQTFKSFTRCTLGEESDTLTMESFRSLLCDMSLDLVGTMGERMAGNVRHLRASITICNMSRMILRAAGVEGETRFNNQRREDGPVLMAIEMLVAVVIVLNAFTMGVAEDVAWNGWPYVDACFAVFFCVEIAMKLRFHGPSKYLCGVELLWNWGDIVIACSAMVDFVVFNLLNLGGPGDLSNITLIRLLRLIRLTRLVKLLHLKVFRELKLIVRGVFFGLRTLAWAIVLFVFLLYCIALMIRLLLAPADGSAPSQYPYCDPSEAFCERSQHLIDLHYEELFSDTPRCVITLLRCFTDGCASVDGTPLIPTLFNIYGYPVLIPYILFMFFITFGLFNLITAILVENTVDAAKNDKARGMNLRRAEQLRIATRLKELVDRARLLCAESKRSDGNPSALRQEENTFNAVEWVLRWFGMHDTHGQHLQNIMDDMADIDITAEVFADLVWDHEISQVLDALDISAYNREALFDVLDADGSGSVSAEELITGLLKLRGSAEKSDVVGVLLGVRSLQREVKGHLKPTIRVLGGLAKDTSARILHLEESVARLFPAAKGTDIKESECVG